LNAPAIEPAAVTVEGGAKLSPFESRVFVYREEGLRREGFVLRLEDGFVAYANRCPHWGVDLDFGIGEFYVADLGKILCRNHGALFEPRSGRCEWGPCIGLFLKTFEVRRLGANLVVQLAPLP
jgi:nitrite reductase/ring-hydroxylating ferredoxin subunit